MVKIGEGHLVKEKEKQKQKQKPKKEKALVTNRTSRIFFYLEEPICASKHKYLKVRGLLIMQVGQNKAESYPAELVLFL